MSYVIAHMPFTLKYQLEGSKGGGALAPLIRVPVLSNSIEIMPCKYLLPRTQCLSDGFLFKVYLAPIIY